MEEKRSHKKRYIAAAFIAAAICLIGAGFAILYTGEVNNTGNDTDVKFVVLTLGSDQEEDYADAFDGTIYYDTYTTAFGTTYTPQYDTDTDNDGIDDAVLLGTVVINSYRNGSEDTYSIEMTKTAGTMTGDYILGVRAGSAALTFIEYSDDVVIVNNANTDLTVTVSLYYSAAPMTSEPGNPMNNVTFKFTANAIS